MALRSPWYPYSPSQCAGDPKASTLLGELIGELSISHTYVAGGDLPDVRKVNCRLLGADYTLDAASRHALERYL